MKLEMIKGLESSLIIEDVVDSINENGFLADSYSKALDALNSYMSLSDKTREELLEEADPSRRNGVLYRAPQNIIAFSGRRGSGKSSTMLSFSELLSDTTKLKSLCDHPKPNKDYTKLKDRRFIVVDSIDPTTLEGNQSILSAVLSRLLFKAEESWRQNISFYGNFQEKENNKTNLLSLARRCLNGISAIKDKNEIPKELMDLQRVGDSSILKKDLYDFVDLFLQFCVGERNIDLKNCMLVLQIDDTDCQIKRGYEVIEDIRKYLTIPNVLILMATDTRLLRQVLTQHYISDFSNSLDKGLIVAEELRQQGEKHLTKLMPPSHVIYLPNIDEVIRDRTDAICPYYYEDDACDKKKNLLLPYGCEVGNYEIYHFQSLILRYIYKKTHIVFASHDAYANNIIPTSLRGLAYLLDLLSSMEDIPEIDTSQGTFDANYLADALETQFPIIEYNLNLFEAYFLHDWIQAKLLPKGMIEILEKLADQVPSQRIPYITKELVTYYQSRVDDGIPFPDRNLDNPTFADLDELMRTIQGTKDSSDKRIAFRKIEDLYFIFAIRTLLTIKNNKDVLKVKRRIVKNFKKGEDKPIVFNYLKEKTSLPTGFYLDPVRLYEQPLVADKAIEYNDSDPPNLFDFEENKSFFNSVYFRADGRERFFNFIGAVIQWLAPQKEDYQELTQLETYQAQELSALVAANCDVQEVIRKAVARKAREYAGKSNLGSAVEDTLVLVQNAVANINQGMFTQYKSKEEETSFWEIGKQFKELIKKFEIVVLGVYPKFDLEPPKIYDRGRIEEFKKELLNYERELNENLESKGIAMDLQCKTALSQVIDFDFGRLALDITAIGDFPKKLKGFYKVMDNFMLNNS